MDLEGIISVSGKGGLFKMVGQSKAHLIVEEIGGGKRFPVYASDRVSALADISIYTEEDDIPLGDVFSKIHKKENGGACVDHKSGGAELRTYMADVMPDYDEERVYDSDLKKLFQWYNILQAADMLKEKVESAEDAEVVKEDASSDETTEASADVEASAQEEQGDE